MASVDVSIVMPVHNGSRWLNDSLSSILSQTFKGRLELSVYNDKSNDSTSVILKSWQPRLEQREIKMVIGGSDRELGKEGGPRGTGYGRNQAIKQSSGKFLCFLDADDVMASERIATQYSVAVASDADVLIGSCFTRHPPGSTERYTRWCNSLSQSQLYTQAFTAFGPTIIQPTWFCSRDLFDKVGPFSEQGKGTPEDLMFFYKHLSLGGKLLKIEKDLLMYRHHPDCESFSVSRLSIWQLRVDAVQESVLAKWKKFTIWNAGKQGRRLYRSLSLENQTKVVAFCDVDENKIKQGIYIYEESRATPKPRIPIIHFTEAKPPFILCVKWDLTRGEFEDNLASLSLKEGEDYYHFS